MQDKYRLKYTGEVFNAIFDLTKKYNIAIDPNLSLEERIKKENPSLIIFDLAKKIVAREGSFKDIIENLKSKFGFEDKIAEELAHDIKNKVVILTEIIREEPQDENNKEEYRQAVLEKIRMGDRPKNLKTPDYNVKKVEVENVEDNAKIIEDDKKFANRKEILRNQLPQSSQSKEDTQQGEQPEQEKNPFENEKKGPDDYREKID